MFSFGILFPQASFAQTSLGGIIINANSSEHDTVHKIVRLSGNVQVVFKHNHMRADEAEIDLLKKTILANGHVALENPKAHLEGTRMLMNYETVTGVIYDGFVQSGRVTFEGEMIEKIGPEDYVAHNGRYTACTNCPEDWSFSGSTIKATLGGYADITYPILRVRGVPIFISPWLTVPLKSSRESGFLVPGGDFSNLGGGALEIPYFWAISKSQDMTITGKRYDKRGYKAIIEHRYILNRESAGTLHTAYMYDKAFLDVNQNILPIDRWFVDYHHYYVLPDNYIQRTKIAAASDLRYQIDFPVELKGNADPALENRVSLTKNKENTHASAEAAYYINLLKNDPLAPNTDAVHRLPELRYSLMREKIKDTPFVFQASMDYVNFYRSGYGYDNAVSGAPYCRNGESICILHGADGLSQLNTGRFNPNTDFIRSGQRLDLSPQISAPFRVLKVFDVLPVVSYHEVQYGFNINSSPSVESASDSAARRYVQTDIGVRTRFDRIFSLGKSSSPTVSPTSSSVYGPTLNPSPGPSAVSAVAQEDKIKHIIEPSITYSTIPWIRQPNHVFFGDTQQPYYRTLDPISDNDVTGTTRVQFDGYDRVYSKRLIDFGVTNYFNKKSVYGIQNQYSNIVTWRVSQSYDLNEVGRDLDQPLSSLNSTLDIRVKHFETYIQNAYYPYAKVPNTYSSFRVFDDKGDFVQLSYLKKYLINLDNQVDYSGTLETLGFNLGYVSRIFSLTGGLNFSPIALKTIQSWQFISIFRPPTGCWSIQIGAAQVIGGNTNFHFNFAFDFGGKATPQPVVN